MNNATPTDPLARAALEDQLRKRHAAKERKRKQRSKAKAHEKSLPSSD